MNRGFKILVPVILWLIVISLQPSADSKAATLVEYVQQFHEATCELVSVATSTIQGYTLYLPLLAYNCFWRNTNPSDIEDYYLPGSQYFASGPVSARPQFKELTQLNSENRSTHFSSEYLNDRYILGGTCTAMAFDFAFNVADKCRPLKANSLDDILKCISTFSKHYQTSNHYFRSVQAALNTIAMEKDENSCAALDRPMREKVATIAEFYGFDIGIAYPRTPVVHWDSATRAHVPNLPNGVYLVRAILFDDNHKCEQHGHSTVFVKTAYGSLFYDPNHGVQGIARGKEGQFLAKKLNEQYDDFDIYYGRLYQLILQE